MQNNSEDLVGIESLRQPQSSPPSPVLQGQEDHREEHEQEDRQEGDRANDQDVEVGLNCSGRSVE